MASAAYEEFRLAVALDCGWVAGEMMWPKNSPCEVERDLWNRLRLLERAVEKRNGYSRRHDFYECDGVGVFSMDEVFAPPDFGVAIGWSLCGREVLPRPSLDVIERTPAHSG